MSKSTPEMDVSSIELARMAREQQGNYEMEACFGNEEADLHVHYNSCKKNPGHPKFIPVKKFSIEHLISSWRHPLVFETIQLLADWTVRLKMCGASAARPSHFPFSGKQFRNARRYGTGFAMSGTGLLKSQPCSMPNCNISDEHKEHGPIFVDTAAHVVFDESEAQNTTVDFFFDDSDRSGVMTARVTKFENINDHSRIDRAVLICFTHDVKLIEKLDSIEGRAKSIKEKWRNMPLKDLPSGVINLGAIASHPHGLSKYISLGRIYLDYLANVNAKYETCTCPGSSGAAVLFFKYSEGRRAIFPYHYTHSGKGNEGLNNAAQTGPVPSEFC